MADTFFSKLDSEEKKSRLAQIASVRGKITTWVKGSKEKKAFDVLSFDRERSGLVLDSVEEAYRPGQTVLSTFDFRGMSFFSETVFQRAISKHSILLFTNDLYKSERRASYRLLTYPIYKVWAEFDLGEAYEGGGGKVIDLKTKTSQTGLFKDFLKLVESHQAESGKTQRLKIRIQDLSITGMALHVGELESRYFLKDLVFNQVTLRFEDEEFQIPKTKVVYVVDYISSDRNLKSYKVGCQFVDLPTNLDEKLGKKINLLLRQIDFNKDFENFVK